jgi:hypothetical protein
MKRFLRWLVDALRPWHNNGLPDELQLPENPHWFFTKDAMERAASLMERVADLTSQGLKLGVFEILGATYASRAVRAWRPRELLLMEDVSLAFFEVEDRISRGIHVAPVHIQRLVEVLHRYYGYHKDYQTRESIVNKIAEYRKKKELYQSLDATDGTR